MGDPANKSNKAQTKTTKTSTVSQADFGKLKKQLADNKANTSRIEEALQKEKDTHAQTAEELSNTRATAQNDVDARTKAENDLTASQTKLSAANELIEQFKAQIKESGGATSSELVDTEEETISLYEVLELVKREVPETGKDGKSTGKMIAKSIRPDEVLAFKDHGDHVVVVTVSGEKIRGDK